MRQLLVNIEKKKIRRRSAHHKFTKIQLYLIALRLSIRFRSLWLVNINGLPVF